MKTHFDLIADASVSLSLLLYISALISVVYVYLRLRPSRLALVSDIFVIAVVVLWGPAMILYTFLEFPPYIQPAFELISRPGVVAQTYAALTVGIISWISGFVLTEGTRIRARESYSATKSTAWPLIVISTIYIGLLIALVVTSSDGRRFIGDLAIYMLDPTTDQYTYIRRTGYDDSFLFKNLLARLRYSANALFYTILIVSLAQVCAKSVAISIAVALSFVVTFSISKMPSIFYLGYAVLACFIISSDLLRIDKPALIKIVAAFVVLIGGLTSLYIVQYSENVRNGEFSWADAGALALYRLFGTNIDILRIYIAAYPAILPFGYGAGTNLIATLVGIPYRDYSVEIVGVYAAGSEGLTSNPTVFVGSAFAEFGMLGVALIGFGVGMFISIVQRALTRLRNRILYASTVSVCVLNCIFFLTLPAPVTLLSYGMATVPILAFVLQYLLRVITR